MPRPRPAVPLEKVTLHLPENLMERLRRAANAGGVTLSRLVARLVDDGLNNE